MQQYTSVRPRSAIAAAVFFGTVTGYVLFEDVIRHNAPISTKHVMTLAVLFGTIYFGHRSWPQFRAGHIVSALMCALLFLGGTYMCVFMAAGRNAEVIQTKQADARKHNGQRDSLQAGVEAAKADRDLAKVQAQAAIEAQADADKAMQAACSSKAKGARLLCRSTSDASKAAAARVDQAGTAAERAEARYWELVGKLANEPPARLENGDIKALAAVYAKLPWVQASADAIEAAHVLLIPIGLALFAEMGLIAACSMRERRLVSVKSVSELPNQTEPSAGVGGGLAEPSEPLPPAPPVRKGGPMTKLEAEAYVVTQLALGRELPSQDWLRAQCGLSKATASDWVKEWRRRGLIVTVRSGHCNVIRAGRKLQSA